MSRFFPFIGIISVPIIAVAVSFCSVVAQTPPDKQADAALPDGPAKAIIKKSCSPCHTAGVIVGKPGHTDDEWFDILNKMVGRGAILSDEDGDTLLQYLSANFGPSWKGISSVSAAIAGTTPSAAVPSTNLASVNVNKASAQELQAALGVTANEAELIVRHREHYGNYKTWKDVSSVPGVAAEQIEKNQKRLTF